MAFKQSEEEDLYAGYASTTTGRQNGSAMGATAWRPPTSTIRAGIGSGSGGGGGVPPSRAGMGTAMPQDGAPRPMTAMKAAGYTSGPARPVTGREGFGGAGPGTGGAPPPLKNRDNQSPEEVYKDLEKQVHHLLEESAAAAAAGDKAGALDKAKEAGKRERLLCKRREDDKAEESPNKDLKFAVCFNLALMYQKSRMYTDALNAYNTVVKNKGEYPNSNAGVLRVNMGNCHFEQKKYPAAIKMYRMAMDQLPADNKELKFKVLRNIGNAFVEMGQYADAEKAYEMIMESKTHRDQQTGFNLLLCQYALGDPMKMKAAFTRLLETAAAAENLDPSSDADELFDALPDLMVQDDGLRDELRRRRQLVLRRIGLAGRLIAPRVVAGATGFEAGFDWVISELERYKFVGIKNEMEMAKALTYLNMRDFDKATSLLKSFELKERDLKATAATNLSFLSFLEGAADDAEKHADLAMAHDKYNAAPLVNRGNCCFLKGDMDSAKTCYEEAVGVEPDCVEALYNLGLTHTRAGAYDAALNCFKKLHKMMPQSAEVIFQIGNVYDRRGGDGAAAEAAHWFELLQSRPAHQHDPGVLARLGAVYAKEEDEAKALHYFSESHRVYPVNMDVITWLGAFYVRSEVYEKAAPFFERAARLQPGEVKWRLMVASCFRRMERLPAAYDKYKEVLRDHPDNLECLRYLKQICTELQKSEEATEYGAKLRRAEKAQAALGTGPTTFADMGVGSIRSGPPVARAPLRDVAEVELGEQAAAAGFFAAPSAPQAKRAPAPAKKPSDDDEWGGGELGDDLLPM